MLIILYISHNYIGTHIRKGDYILWYVWQNKINENNNSKEYSVIYPNISNPPTITSFIIIGHLTRKVVTHKTGVPQLINFDLNAGLMRTANCDVNLKVITVLF